MRWTVKTRLWVMTGISVFNLIVMIVVGSYYVNHLSQDVHRLGFVELPASRHMAMADMMHDGIRGTAFRAIIRGDSKDHDEAEEIKGELTEYADTIEKSLDELAMLNISPELTEKVKTTRDPVKEYVSVAKDIVHLSLGSQQKQALEKVTELQVAFEALERSLADVGHLVAEEIDNGVQESEKYAKSAKSNLYLFAVMSLTLAVGIAFYFIRQLIKAIKGSMEILEMETSKLGNSAEQVMTTSGSLKENSTEQAAAVQETATSLEQINSMVSKTSENSGRLSIANEKSLSIVNQGQESVREVYDAVRDIQQTNEFVASQIEDSNRRIADIVKVINEIGQKTQVINEIVFQTKLLSFNASVEAARAGENGKGFAVVATEVGNLAQSSGRAAKEISDMLTMGIQTTNEILNDSKAKIANILSASKQKVDHGSEVVEKCRTTLKEIVIQIDEMSKMITEITGAINEQTVGISEITRAVHVFDKSSQNNAQMSNLAMGISGDLVRQFHSMQNAMADLRILVGQEAITTDVKTPLENKSPDLETREKIAS